MRGQACPFIQSTPHAHQDQWQSIWPFHVRVSTDFSQLVFDYSIYYVIHSWRLWSVRTVSFLINLKSRAVPWFHSWNESPYQSIESDKPNLWITSLKRSLATVMLSLCLVGYASTHLLKRQTKTNMYLKLFTLGISTKSAWIHIKGPSDFPVQLEITLTLYSTFICWQMIHLSQMILAALWKLMLWHYLENRSNMLSLTSWHCLWRKCAMAINILSGNTKVLNGDNQTSCAFL